MPEPLFLSTAIEAVLEAGRIQLSYFRSGVRIDKKGAIDIVTEADVAVERMFRALIAERFPAHAVVAEEMGQGGAEGATHEWVFDPIDGTTNFAHGIPFFCASLALEVNGVAEVAAIYEPSRRELYTAERGVGAWLNGEPLRVSSTSALIDAVVCTGFPYSIVEEREAPVALFGRFLGVSRAVRRFGSAALDLAWVAAGRYDNPLIQSRDVPVDAVSAGLPHTRRAWFRVRAPLPDEPDLHLQTVAYLSDFGATRAVREPHAHLADDASRRSVSLDHSVWFHRPVDASGWLLSELTPMASGRGRGLAVGTIRTEDGHLVATVAQEVMLRERS